MSAMTSLSSWLKNTWRPAAAYVYLLICLCDFAAMPIYYAVIASKNANVENVQLALKFNNPATQIEALRVIRQATVWEPITLQQTGLFHMAFGGILGVAAWTRGQEKVQSIRNGLNPDAPVPQRNRPQPPQPARPQSRPPEVPPHMIEGGPHE